VHVNGVKQAQGRQLRVLVAEDSEDDYELLLRALRAGGYHLTSERVQTAEGMAAALDRGPWDIAFSDWSMPRFTAPDALRVLQESAHDLPFIIVSGTVGEDTAVEALKAGARDFLVKDKLTRLIPAVERELREAEVRQERRKMQEQLLISDRMASVGLLAAGTAHEINNPLASVLANLDLALRHVTEIGNEHGESARLTSLKEELSDARESSERIRHIVRDLKLFSRADDEQKVAVDVRRVLESSLRMAQNEVKHRANLIKDYTPVPGVLANESRLGQVFLNLIINAAQSIPEGHAEENEIRVSTGMSGDGRVAVEISDTGSGMSQAVIKRLFTPFFTTKPVGVGTGLGLSICHRIIKSLGGDINVQSTPGVGTTFQVLLVVAQTTLTAVRTAEPVQRAAPVATRRGRILVVDDEPMVSTALRRVLSEDHDVVELNRAQDALARVEVGERFDLIVSDLMMPAMSGMDLHEALLKCAPDQAAKMIFLTGGAFTTKARTFLDTVTNLRIEKPFDASVLCAIVNERIR
jgi:signal transduction histidine kinase